MLRERHRFWSRISGRRIVAADSQARQGPRGRPVLIVLVGSLLLLGIYLAATMVWVVVDTPMSPRDPLAVREGVEAQEPPVLPSSALNRNDPPAANPAYPVPAVPYIIGGDPTAELPARPDVCGLLLSFLQERGGKIDATTTPITVEEVLRFSREDDQFACRSAISIMSTSGILLPAPLLEAIGTEPAQR